MQTTSIVTRNKQKRAACQANAFRDKTNRALAAANVPNDNRKDVPCDQMPLNRKSNKENDQNQYATSKQTNGKSDFKAPIVSPKRERAHAAERSGERFEEADTSPLGRGQSSSQERGLCGRGVPKALEAHAVAGAFNNHSFKSTVEDSEQNEALQLGMKPSPLKSLHCSGQADLGRQRIENKPLNRDEYMEALMSNEIEK